MWMDRDLILALYICCKRKLKKHYVRLGLISYKSRQQSLLTEQFYERYLICLRFVTHIVITLNQFCL